MKINSKIKEILTDYKITIKDGVSYLILLYYDCIPSYVPSSLMTQLNKTNIYSFESSSIQWNVKLFEEQITGFEWVVDWMKLFSDINKERRGVKNTCIARMKKFFAEFPDIRKEDVVEATKMYLDSLKGQDRKFLKTSHKFIYEGSGTEKMSHLKEWVDKYKIASDIKSLDRTDIRNVLQ